MLFVGHRGASAYEPENTIRSLSKAFELGANAVEFDIRQTKDGEVVLMHDARLLRTARKMSKVGALTLDEMERIRVNKTEPIPTLKEALRLCGKKNKVAIVEFKEDGMEKQAVELFRKSKRVIAISSIPEVLAHLKFLMPELETGILFKKKVDDLDSFLAWAGMLKVDWLVGKSSALSTELVAQAHHKGFRVIAWVLNRKKSMLKVIGLGVDGLESNKPELFNTL
jgi:glycerophosphoryl diester phosphodiesterase